jgi:hypothetical protein
MSIVDRLFPASELEHLRASPYDFDLQPAAKRRKLSSTSSASIGIHQTTTSDSGYSSDEDCPIPDSWLRPRSKARASVSSASSQHSEQEPPSPSLTQSALFREYLANMRCSQSTQHRIRTGSEPSYTSPEAMKAFYQRITQARTRSRSSISGLPTPPFPDGGSIHIKTEALDEHAETCVSEVGQGWTAGPKAAKVAQVSARVLDGMRLTSHERSMLSSLIPESTIPQNILLQIPQSISARRAHQRKSAAIRGNYARLPSFAGISIRYDEEENDENGDEGMASINLDHCLPDGEGTGKVEDFFNIDEAASDDCPEANASPSASSETS